MGWHAYFWLSFLPLILLVTVGAKLEHIISQLAQDFAEKRAVEQAHTGVKPSDEHFWFGRPKIILYLIHFILFQNSFEIAFFFWIWSTYGFDSCIMEKVGYIVPRLIFGVMIQVLCSYSTLPLYAIVTQMGTMFKPEIFQEHLSLGIREWADDARKDKKEKTSLAKTSLAKMSFGRRKSEDDHSVLKMQKMATETHANCQSVIMEGITTIAESSDSDN